MNTLATVVNATLPVFALILTGFLCARKRLLGDTATDVLNRFVVYLALPAIMFEKMATTKLSELFNVNFLAAFGIGMMLTFTIAYLLARRSRGSQTDASIDGLAASYPNTAFMGIPLCLAVFGPDGMPSTVIATFLVVCVLMAVSSVLIELELQGKGSVPQTLQKIVISLCKNPLLIAPVLGIVFACTRQTIPAPVDSFLKLLGGASTPCALVTIGLFLAQKQSGGSMVAVGRIIFLKLLFQPAVTTLLVLTVFKMSPLWTHAAILLSALPIGTGPFMLAKLYNRDAAVASRSILFTTLGSLITISILIALFH